MMQQLIEADVGLEVEVEKEKELEVEPEVEVEPIELVCMQSSVVL